MLMINMKQSKAVDENVNNCATLAPLFNILIMRKGREKGGEISSCNRLLRGTRGRRGSSYVSHSLLFQLHL